jgi:hypothetical protein
MARDPEILYPTDTFAYSGRAIGFIPSSIFYKEETALLGIKPEVIFFQDFGLSIAGWFKSIRENERPEVTVCDIYDFKNQVGRWAGFGGHAHMADQKAIAALLENGFVLPPPHETPERRVFAVWPPKLELVQAEPEWVSVMQDVDYARNMRQSDRREMDSKIVKACSRCAVNEPLALHNGWTYMHGKKFENLVDCGAEKLHRQRSTLARVITDPAYEADEEEFA